MSHDVEAIAPEQRTDTQSGIVLTDATVGQCHTVSGKTANCPRCGAGPDKRTSSCGFGPSHPVCTQCAYEDFEP